MCFSYNNTTNHFLSRWTALALAAFWLASWSAAWAQAVISTQLEDSVPRRVGDIFQVRVVLGENDLDIRYVVGMTYDSDALELTAMQNTAGFQWFAVNPPVGTPPNNAGPGAWRDVSGMDLDPSSRVFSTGPLFLATFQVKSGAPFPLRVEVGANHSSIPPLALDANLQEVPVIFRNDATLELGGVTDAEIVATLLGMEPQPRSLADANGDGAVDVADLIAHRAPMAE